ncbi:MAG: HAMP domain-containing histidine kinase [Synergistaceae bacterium]|jgi:signal transduction histidine kinase|nr:HAMP domain-containing histidine kinase [Synergistaceae bacterium]
MERDRKIIDDNIAKLRIAKNFLIKMQHVVSFRTIRGMFMISGVTVLFVSLCTRLFVGYLTGEMEYNIRGRLIEVSKRGASLVTAEELDRFHEAGDMNFPEYLALREKLRDFSADADVLYVYYLRVENGMLQYIVDNDFDESTRVGLDTPPTDAALAPGLAPALEGRAGFSGLGNYMVNWKGLLSAYAPLFDKDGNVAAVCGADINDEEILAARERARALWVLELALIAAVFAFGFLCIASYRRKAESARESNIAKGRFMTRFSHEMKTPLTVISAKVQFVASLLKHDGDFSEICEMLDKVKDEAARLARMSDAMTSLEIASGSFDEMGDVDLACLFREITAAYKILAERSENRLVSDIPDDIPHIQGNADGLSQVLINLIANADEHTSNGEITVSIVRDGETVTASVSDNGEGVPPEALPGVFERKPLRARDGEVNGIGLSICRDIVTNHSGRIWMESSPGVGTAVYFTLPVQRG